MPKGERAKSKAMLKMLDAAVKGASRLLFWAKFAPELKKDRRIHAKWPSHDLKVASILFLGRLKGRIKDSLSI
jgi:hypothetical protein